MNWRSWVGAGLVVVAGAAWADWNPGGPHKMHFPQLPDPNGWDVSFTFPTVLADDWLCTAAGPVSDVHLWFSSKSDAPFVISNVHLSIHADVPVGPGIPYSRPGAMLWFGNFGPGQFSIRPYESGDQGWLYPPEDYTLHDHSLIYQLNITSIPNPFYQEYGKIYWLDVSVSMESGLIGWKTSLQHFQDDAVWGLVPDPTWHELRDPLTQASLDLAFVIVPEPSTFSLAVLTIVALAACHRRRR